MSVLIDEYFNLLEDWKRLPAYRLETRIDSLVGFALPKVIEAHIGFKVAALIPELPLRLGTLEPDCDPKRADLSYRLDFYVRTCCGQNIFIEFKSDSKSRRPEQDNYLALAEAVGMRAIVDGIIRVSEVSPYKTKYDWLLSKLAKAGLVIYSEEGYRSSIDDEPIKSLYIQPRRLEGDEDKEILDFRMLSDLIVQCFPSDELMTRLGVSLKRWSVD